MPGGVGQADQTAAPVRSALLSEAAAISEDLRSAAGDQAGDLVVVAAVHAERIVEAAARQADAVRASAAHRVEALRTAASADAEAELASAARCSDEAMRVARRAGQRLREGAHDRAGRIVAEAERRAEGLVASARRSAAAVEMSPQKEAEAVAAGVTQEASRRLADARLGLDEAVAARRAAEREVALIRGAAVRRAAEVTEMAGQDLEVARRLRTFAGRDAGGLLASAMDLASRCLDTANREFDTANALLVEELRGPQPLVVHPAGPAPAAVGDAEMTAAPVDEPAVDAPAEAPVDSTGSLLVPVLSFGRELVLRLLVLAGAATAAWFWLWWLAIGHGDWTPGSVTATALLGWVFGLSAYFFFFVCRMSRPNPALPVPELRVAMVVTKAPSEPWEVVRSTLQATLAQDFERPYDVWLADERPAPDTLQWCLDHDVKVSSRHGVEEYHRPVWPRRTKCKEGNLAWFYDQVGYDRYDVVAQLDADHAPAPGYLEAMVRPFAVPAVGYVSAPSVCDANVEEGWTVRGRLYREASMHGPVQAGCNGGYAPVCIGSHYAVRTAALRDVGGLGPELAEDYSTTLWLLAGGWLGVFSIDAEAHGEGPATLDEMLVQELQWSRSLCTILFRWAPGRLGRVPWRARLRLAFALLYYPLQGVAVAVATALPLVGLVSRAPWGDTSLTGFYVHLWPSSLVALATAAYLRQCRLLRPVKAKVWSWELLLFQLVRWPWTLWGVVQGTYAGLRSKSVNFRVTPKAVSGPRPLHVRYLLPTLALGLVPAWVAVLVGDAGPALGLLLVAALEAVTYLSGACAVVVLHMVANRRRRHRTVVDPAREGPGISPWRAGRAAVAMTLAAVVPTLVALVWRLWTVGLSV